MKRYKVSEKEKKILVDLHIDREHNQYMLGNDDIEIEVEGANMWVISKSDGERRLTDNHPFYYIKNGWIEPIDD